MLLSFSSPIKIIGINPYVLLPKQVLDALFKQAGKSTSPIQIRGNLQGHPFIQNLVRYQGKWRLYLNTPMRKAAGIDVGDIADFEIEYDPEERTIAVNPKLTAALHKNKKANAVFTKLRPSLQKEIVRYIANLKTEESIDRNITKAINFLLGKERFIGRDKPE